MSVEWQMNLGQAQAFMPAAQPRPETPKEKDAIEKKTEELILMTSGKGPRRWRQRKSEYLRKLEQDNTELKSLNVDLQQQISALKAQNDILRDQLSYFQTCLAQAGPLMFQQPAQKE